MNDFFAYSWHIDENETNKTIIRIYGLDSKNENVCVIVENFYPYIYVELPSNINWTESLLNPIIEKIEKFMQSTPPLEKEFIYKKRLYYAYLDKNGKRTTFPYLRLSFAHSTEIKKMSGFFRRPMHIYGLGEINFKVHENNVSPILQLTSIRKIPTAGWISFTGKKIIDEKDKFTTCKHEYIVKYKDLFPKQSDKVARPLLMGWDIEVFSSNPNSMPKATKPEDKVFQISCVFTRQGAPQETWEKYILTLGKSASIENANVLCFETENDLFLGYIKLIQQKQPNIIIGYNIFQFDINYMVQRSKSVLLNINEFDKQGMTKYGHARERTIEWDSSAYKNQAFQFLDAEGIIFVDLLPIIKREFKLNNYQLKTVALHFLKNITKDPLDYKAIFKCYRIGMAGGLKGEHALALVGKYCIKDSELVIRIFEITTSWISLCEMSKITNVPIFALFTQGQQLKVFSQIYKKCIHDNYVVERDAYITKENEHYIGATVFPPIPGVYDKVAPFDFTSLYPTSIIATNIDYSTLVPEDSKIDDSKCNILEWEEHVGCEHDPKIIRKKEILEILKIMSDEMKELRKKRDLKRNLNIKQEIKNKLIEINEKMKPLRDEKKRITESKNIFCGKRKYKWLKEPKGILPEILTNLLETRSITKKAMKNMEKKLETLVEGSPEYLETKTQCEVLDKRQNALKISANSGYGAMGVRKGILPFMPGAMCTTYVGRKAIEKAASVIQKDYGGVLIYGDTDSNYVSFPSLNAEECWDYSIKVAQEVSKLYPKPMSLAFEEKIYWRFLILTKKRYMSLSCKRDGKISNEMCKKGVLLNRRDTCDFIRKVYENVIMDIFNKKDIKDILSYILDEIYNLCSGSYNWKSFIITKEVGSDGNLILTNSKDKNGQACTVVGDYKINSRYLLSSDEKERASQLEKKGVTNVKDYYLKCIPAQVQLAHKMKIRGYPVSAGTRLEYVITTEGGQKALQSEKIENADYFNRHSNILRIDYEYYLKLLSNPLDQVLEIIYGKRDFTLTQYKYRTQIREKVLKNIKELFQPKIKFEQ